MVLDPLRGCGTAVDAAQRLGRRWVGIDITYLAIDLIENRLITTYGPEVKTTYRVQGIPHGPDGAQALFDANPFDFEVGCVAGRRPAEHEAGRRRGLRRRRPVPAAAQVRRGPGRRVREGRPTRQPRHGPLADRGA